MVPERKEKTVQLPSKKKLNTAYLEKITKHLWFSPSILRIYMARRKFKSLTIHKIIMNIKHISTGFDFKK